MPSYCLNQCWNIVNAAIGNKFQWNLNLNPYIFSQENAFSKVSSGRWRPICLHQCIHRVKHFIKRVRNLYRSPMILNNDCWLIVTKPLPEPMLKKLSIRPLRKKDYIINPYIKLLTHGNASHVWQSYLHLLALMWCSHKAHFLKSAVLIPSQH